MSELTELPNIGKVAAGKLNAVGIFTYEELVEAGSINAVLRIREENLDTCFSMLCAIEGAIRGIRWHQIPKEEREALKQKFVDTAGL